jgi:hypothetical protein
MEMTEEQRAVLAYVVPDPDSWYAHALATFGEVNADELLLSKVYRWQAEYDAAVVLPGYQTRAERDAAANAPKVAVAAVTNAKRDRERDLKNLATAVEALPEEQQAVHQMILQLLKG